MSRKSYNANKSKGRPKNKKQSVNNKKLKPKNTGKREYVRNPASKRSPMTRNTVKGKEKKSLVKKTQPRLKPLNQSQKTDVQRKVAILPSKSYDFSVLFIVVMLVLFGIVMIFSSSYYNALIRHNDMYYFLKRQALWAAIGLGVMMFMMNFDYHHLKYFSKLLYIFSVICLILVLFIGQNINGSTRWLGIGPFSFQPSELAKIAIIIFAATFLSGNRDILKSFKGFILVMIAIFLPVGLIALKNLSTAIVAAFVGIVIIFLSTPKLWYFLPMVLPIIPAAIVMVTHEEFRYRMNRITAWLDPFADASDTGFQTVQSLYAVASGGIFGLGLGQSRQKLGYIPEAYNDIIFSIICEELGLVGAITLIILFMLLIYRGIKIALNAQDLYGCLMSSGITGMIGIQVLINIAVITNTIPVTGMPLPFISYGGSSLVILLGSIGILLNISKYSK